MKFNDLCKRYQFLVYLHRIEEVGLIFKVNSFSNDAISRGYASNKNALCNMLNSLKKDGYIINDEDHCWVLTDSGEKFADSLINRLNADDNNAQPNNFENDGMNNTTNAMKNAFESMAKSFESMKKSFETLNKTSNNAIDIDRIQECADAIDYNITYLVTRFDTVYNAIKNGNESPNKIIECMNEIYEGGIKYLIHNNNELKKAIPQN